jgi:hypothetical protein
MTRSGHRSIKVKKGFSDMTKRRPNWELIGPAAKIKRIIPDLLTRDEVGSLRESE